MLSVQYQKATQSLQYFTPKQSVKLRLELKKKKNMLQVQRKRSYIWKRISELMVKYKNNQKLKLTQKTWLQK